MKNLHQDSIQTFIFKRFFVQKKTPSSLHSSIFQSFNFLRFNNRNRRYRTMSYSIFYARTLDIGLRDNLCTTSLHRKGISRHSYASSTTYASVVDDKFLYILDRSRSNCFGYRRFGLNSRRRYDLLGSRSIYRHGSTLLTTSSQKNKEWTDTYSSGELFSLFLGHMGDGKKVKRPQYNDVP